MNNQTIIAPKGDLFEHLIKAPFGYVIESIVIKCDDFDEIIIPPNPQRHLLTIKPDAKSSNYHIKVFLKSIEL